MDDESTPSEGSQPQSHSLAGRWRSSISARRELALERERVLREAARTLRVHVTPALEKAGLHIAAALRGEEYADIRIFSALGAFCSKLSRRSGNRLVEITFGWENY